jgi:hypothetical protein
VEKANSEINWGVHFNQRLRWAAADPPTWASKAEHEKWGKPGLVLWDQETETITHMTATQALHLLDRLQENDDWKRAEITLGEPATRLSLDEPERKPEQILTHKIYLTPDKTHKLLELLQQVQPDLEVLKNVEEEERARILGKVFNIILGDSWGREKGADTAQLADEAEKP